MRTGGSGTFTKHIKTLRQSSLKNMWPQIRRSSSSDCLGGTWQWNSKQAAKSLKFCRKKTKIREKLHTTRSEKQEYQFEARMIKAFTNNNHLLQQEPVVSSYNDCIGSKLKTFMPSVLIVGELVSLSMHLKLCTPSQAMISRAIPQTTKQLAP